MDPGPWTMDALLSVCLYPTQNTSLVAHPSVARAHTSPVGATKPKKRNCDDQMQTLICPQQIFLHKRLSRACWIDLCALDHAHGQRKTSVEGSGPHFFLSPHTIEYRPNKKQSGKESMTRASRPTPPAGGGHSCSLCLCSPQRTFKIGSSPIPLQVNVELHRAERIKGLADKQVSRHAQSCSGASKPGVCAFQLLFALAWKRSKGEKNQRGVGSASRSFCSLLYFFRCPITLDSTIHFLFFLVPSLFFLNLHSFSLLHSSLSIETSFPFFLSVCWTRHTHSSVRVTTLLHIHRHQFPRSPLEQWQNTTTTPRPWVRPTSPSSIPLHPHTRPPLSASPI